MYFSTKIDYPRIRHCNINRVKYSHKDLIANKEFSDIIKKDKNIIIKIKHILSLNFTQKTMKDLTQMLGNADIKIKKTNN